MVSKYIYCFIEEIESWNLVDPRKVKLLTVPPSSCSCRPSGSGSRSCSSRGSSCCCRPSGCCSHPSRLSRCWICSRSCSRRCSCRRCWSEWKLFLLNYLYNVRYLPIRYKGIYCVLQLDMLCNNLPYKLNLVGILWCTCSGDPKPQQYIPCSLRLKSQLQNTHHKVDENILCNQQGIRSRMDNKHHKLKHCFRPFNLRLALPAKSYRHWFWQSEESPHTAKQFKYSTRHSVRHSSCKSASLANH